MSQGAGYTILGRTQKGPLLGEKGKGQMSPSELALEAVTGLIRRDIRSVVCKTAMCTGYGEKRGRQG